MRQLIDDAKHLAECANETRTLADRVEDAAAKLVLLEIAKSYDRPRRRPSQ